MVLAPGTRSGSNDVAPFPATAFGAARSTSVPSAPAPSAALTSKPGMAASASAPKFGKGKKGARTGNKQDKGVTFPTVDEIPVVAPVDVASLPDDVRAYREERAKNWPGRAREEARGASEKNAAAGEAEEAERRARRRAQLAEVLAEQRRLGHFEASEEIGEDVGVPGKPDRPGDPGETTGRPGDRRKGRGAKGGGRAGGAPRDPKPAPWRGEPEWTGGAARPSPFESGTIPEPKRRRVDGDGDAPGDVPRRPRDKTTRACRFWNAGTCRRGNACGFRHDGVPGNLAGAPGPYASPVDTDVPSAGNGTECGAVDDPPGDADASGPGDVLSAAIVPGDAKNTQRAAATPCRHFARGRCAAGASCVFSHAAGQTPARRNEQGHSRGRPRVPRASDQSLLKKLFAKEVRVDRSRLLQVFRFLAANDFLRTERRLDALWMFPWADDPERDPERDKQRLRELAAEAQQAQDAEDE